MSEHILFITCSSGQGHMAATQNIKTEISSQNPSAQFHTLDIINYLYPVKPIISDLWNAGIRQDSSLAHLLPKVNSIYEFFYERFLQKKLVSDLKKLFDTYNITQVIDTQPIFTPLLIQESAAQANGQPSFAYHKVLTDLPVDGHHPFFPGIKKRKHFDNLRFFLHGAQPLVPPSQSEAVFWQDHCNIKTEHLSNVWGKPVHRAFKHVPEDPNRIHVQIHPALATHLGLPSMQPLTVQNNASVTTLMMGSQGLDVIRTYFKTLQETYRSQNLEVPHYVFIACSRNENLFRDLLQETLKSDDHAHKLYMIPLEMQPAENVASMMWRSQVIIMRASGLSCIEQLAMDEAAKQAGFHFKPQRFMHAHCKKVIPARLTPAEQSAFLLAHSHGHEKANAIYLQEKLGAILTRVDIIVLPPKMTTGCAQSTQ